MPSITEEVAELRSKMVPLEPFMSPIPKMMPLVPVMCSSVPIRLSSEASSVGLAVCLVRALCPAERLGYNLSDIEVCLPEKPWSKRVENRTALRAVALGACTHAAGTPSSLSPLQPRATRAAACDVVKSL